VKQSDAELLDAWCSGDRKAGNRLLNRYFRPLSRFFASRVKDGHDDDLVQETLEACVHGRDRLHNKNNFRSFLFGVAGNVLRMHLRRQRRFQNVEEVDDQDYDHGAYAVAPRVGRLLHARDDERVLVDALRRLPLPLQLATELYYWEGLRTQEIARIMDLPVGTIRSHLRRGRLLLAQSLAGQLELGHDSWDDARARLDQWAHSLRVQTVRGYA